MKKIFLSVPALFATAVLTMAFIKQSNPITEIAIGASIPKPTVKMKDAVNGKEICLNDEKRKNGLVVIFSCNTCPFVGKYEDRMKECYETAKKNKLGFILINSNEAQREKEDSFDAMKSHAKEHGYKFPYVIDNSSYMANEFGASRTPHAFIFDKDGKCVYHGGIDDNANDPQSVKNHYLSDAMISIGEGKPVANNSTKSIGCSIKRKQ